MSSGQFISAHISTVSDAERHFQNSYRTTTATIKNVGKKNRVLLGREVSIKTVHYEKKPKDF